MIDDLINLSFVLINNTGIDENLIHKNSLIKLCHITM